METKNASSTADLDQLIADNINNLDEKGKLQLPEEMPDWQKRLIRGEKRTRDAQSAFSKAEVENGRLKATNDVLMGKIKGSVELQITAEEATALEELKFRDPDAYRIKMNELEGLARTSAQSALDEELTAVVTKVDNEHMATNRVAVLEQFRTLNPTIDLSDDVLVNDVPPRFAKRLNDGDVDYAQYLQEVGEYLVKGKAIFKSDPSDDHDLSLLPGSSTPGKQAAENQGKTDYAKITF